MTKEPSPSTSPSNPAERFGLAGRLLGVFAVVGVGALLFFLFCLGAAYTALGTTVLSLFSPESLLVSHPEYFALAVLTVSYAGLLVAIARPQKGWSWILCLVVGAALAQVPPLAWAEQIEAWRQGGSLVDFRPFTTALQAGVTESWIPYARATFLALCVVPVFLWTYLVQRRGGGGWIALMGVSPVLICMAALASSRWSPYLQLGESLIFLAPTLVFSLWLVLSLYLVRAWHAVSPSYRSGAWSPRLAVREARKQVKTTKLRQRIGWRHASPLQRVLTLLLVAAVAGVIHEAAAPHLYVAKHHKGWLEMGRVLAVVLSLAASGAFVAFVRPKRSSIWLACGLLGLVLSVGIEQAWLARASQLHQGLPATDFGAGLDAVLAYHETLFTVHQGRYMSFLLTPVTAALAVFLWVWLVGRRRFGAWLLVLFLLPTLIPVVEWVLHANGLWAQEPQGFMGLIALGLGQRTPGLTQLFPGLSMGAVLAGALWIQRLKDRISAEEEALISVEAERAPVRVPAATTTAATEVEAATEAAPAA